MAQKGVKLDEQSVTCSICLDLLKDPVTIPCGHSYCRDCIQRSWDGQGGVDSCPQCRQTFYSRPALVKNTMLADVVEQLKKTGLHAAPAEPCYAGAKDVACDVCTGRKVKACKSCLVCLASFCEEHLQPHYDAAPLKKHQLVGPCGSLQENVCSRHNEVKKMFCRTDQQTICYLCSVDHHKGHDTVTAAAERTEKQEDLQKRRTEFQPRIQKREKEVTLLQQEVEAINDSAETSAKASEKMLDELILLLQRKRSEVEQHIRSQQEAEVRKARELQEKLQQEIRQLKKSDAELQKLTQTQDHNDFLHNFSSAPQLGKSAVSFSIRRRPLRYFEEVTAAVSELRDKVQDVLGETSTNIFKVQVDVLLLRQPETRAELIRYSCDVTLDPNTANPLLGISNGNRRARADFQRDCPDHPERFTTFIQVLSRESLTGRCYWEVECEEQSFDVAVAYKNISRGAEGQFGRNDKSWSLECDTDRFNFWNNNTQTPISAPRCSRIGVYLDHSAGILSFYSVTDSVRLIHSVHTTFTQPLYAGIGLQCLFSFQHAEICKL